MYTYLLIRFSNARYLAYCKIMNRIEVRHHSRNRLTSYIYTYTLP